MVTAIRIFVSSKIEELNPERTLLCNLLPTLLNGVIELHPWVYEANAHASTDSTRQIYLDALRNSTLYIGLFWNAYGEWTIDEFEHAREWGIEQHIYVKDVNSASRDPKLTEFLNRNSNVLTSPANKWFKTDSELSKAVEEAIEKWIVGRLHREPERRDRIYHLKVFRQPLWDAYKEYNDYLTKYPDTSNKDESLHSAIIRKAIVACQAINDRGTATCARCLKIPAGKRGFKMCRQNCQHTLAYIAEMRLTPNCVDQSTPGTQQRAEVRQWGWYGDRNINALKDAVARLEELIEALEK